MLTIGVRASRPHRSGVSLDRDVPPAETAGGRGRDARTPLFAVLLVAALPLFADEPVKGEYARGAVAMANSGPNTNGSQFYICHQDLGGKLPKNYTLFGQVTRGLDVVDTIAAGRTGAGDRPVEPVAVTAVTIQDD